MPAIQIYPLFRYHLNIFFLAYWFFLYYSVQPSWCKFNFQAFVSKLCFCFWISLLFVISLSGIVSIFHLIGVMVQGRNENVKKQKVFSAKRRNPIFEWRFGLLHFVQHKRSHIVTVRASALCALSFTSWRTRDPSWVDFITLLRPIAPYAQLLRSYFGVQKLGVGGE